jgi:copper chaperone CopZ
MTNFLSWTAAIVVGFAAVSLASADETTPTYPTRFRVTGLFQPDREDDLRTIFEKLPELRLVAIDFEKAEATVEYDPKSAFPGAKPEQVTERLDQKVRSASNSTFGIRPLSAVPRDKLVKIEIPVLGLDCKACSFAAYKAVAEIEGVEQARASFKDGRVTAWIDESKTSRAALEQSLKQREVIVNPPPSP